MSHFSAFVILDPASVGVNGTGVEVVDRDDVEGALNRVLDKYDESVQVDEYEEACWCVSRKAKVDTIKAIGRFGFWDNDPEIAAEHRAAQAVQFSDNPSKQELEEAAQTMSRIEKLSAAAHKDWKALYDMDLEKHPMYEKPDADCAECNGTAKRMSTYNPDSKWDWWCIGGRWTGLVSGYKPHEDAANQEQCDLCQGTGTRSRPVPSVPNWTPTKGECNGCSGNGTRVRFSYHDHDGDVFCIGIQPPTEHPPFAIITPDGEWHEKGSMGWWAIVVDEKEQDEWDATYRSIIDENFGKLGVVVDFHI